MANYLKMSKRQQVIALLDLGWTYRRIEAETGVRRETVSRYDRWRRSNAAKVFPGSDGSPSVADPGGTDPGDSNPAKVFAGSPSNAAKVFPGSALPARSTAAPYRDAILREARAGPEPAADLARPGRGVRLRRQLRVGQALRPQPRPTVAAR